MPHVPPEIVVVLVMGIPAVIGGWLAWGRGLNPLLWGAACALFPVCLLVVWFSKPRREVKGFFRRCVECGEWIKWHEEPCRYCAYRRERETQLRPPS